MLGERRRIGADCVSSREGLFVVFVPSIFLPVSAPSSGIAVVHVVVVGCPQPKSCVLLENGVVVLGLYGGAEDDKPRVSNSVFSSVSGKVVRFSRHSPGLLDRSSMLSTHNYRMRAESPFAV